MIDDGACGADTDRLYAQFLLKSGSERETAGWEMCKSRAAAVTVPVSQTARKTRRC